MLIITRQNRRSSHLFREVELPKVTRWRLMRRPMVLRWVRAAISSQKELGAHGQQYTGKGNLNDTLIHFVH